MKKFLAILMTLALMASCVAGFSVSSSAEEAAVYAEETYSLSPALEADWGTHEAGEFGTLTAGEAYFGNGLWTFEWFDVNNKVFHPFSAYYKESQTSQNGKCGWADIYYSTEAAMFESLDETYCVIGSRGSQFHPGAVHGTAYTFVVPFTGVISYDAAVKCYGDTNTSDDETKGNCVYLYVNDKQIWPASLEDALFYYDTGDKEVSVPSFSVNKGDKVRMLITVKPDTGNGGKGCNIVEMPVVTYHEAKDEAGNAISVGDPNGTPPANVIPKPEGNSITLTWDAAKNATGYNVFVDGEKVNKDVITETTYTITGLEPKTNYNVTVTTVTAKGESKPSEEMMVRTKAGAASDAKPDAGVSSDKVDNTAASATNTANTAEKDNGSLVWVIVGVVAAVVIVAAVVVVILVVKKKKKA